MTRPEEQLAIAKSIAVLAHRGQVDKAGDPYINHPERVAGRFTTPEYEATAWLHDVLEDSDFTADDLRAAGVWPAIVTSVETLTRKKGVGAEAYYEAIAASYVARKVKLADIADNTDIRRLAKLDDATIVRLVRKYAKALEALS